MDRKDIKLKDLRSSIRRGELLLPNFQRKFVWDVDMIKSLIASIILNYPTGSLLMGVNADSKTMSSNKPLSLEDEDTFLEYANRAGLHEHDLSSYNSPTDVLYDGERYSCEYLLDGQQRLTSIDLAFSRRFLNKDGKLDNKLQHRWFLNVSHLGYPNLEWPEIIEDIPHSWMKEAIETRPYNKKYKKKIDPNDLSASLSFCFNPDGGNDYDLYIPLDEIMRPTKKGDFLSNNITIDKYLRSENALLKTEKGKELEERFKQGKIGEDQYKEEIENLKTKQDEWVDSFHVLVNSIIEFEFPVIQVPSNEFSRLAGIFSVINISGVSLSTFDLLLAKTIDKNKNLRDIFKEQYNIFLQDFKKMDVYKLFPYSKLNFDKDMVVSVFSLGTFLGERKEAIVDVDSSEEFPEKVASLLSQTIALITSINRALGDDWTTRENVLEKHLENKKNPTFIRTSDVLECARSILRLDDKVWGFSESILLEVLTTEEIIRVQDQAVKQLLRAIYYTQYRLGFHSLSNIPYLLMILGIAVVLGDTVWKKVIDNPDCIEGKKLDWWFWSSLFSGVYSKSPDTRIKYDIPRLLTYINSSQIQSWSEVAELNQKNIDQLSHNGTKMKEERFSVGPVPNREEKILGLDGYSTLEALSTIQNKAMSKAIRAIILKDAPLDIDYKVMRRMYPGYSDNTLEEEHLFSIKKWNTLMDSSVKRNEDHPINSPLNMTWLTKTTNMYWNQQGTEHKLNIEQVKNNPNLVAEILEDHLLKVPDVKEFTEKMRKDSKDDIYNAFKTLLERRYYELRSKIMKMKPL